MKLLHCLGCSKDFHNPSRFTHPTHLCVAVRDNAHVTPVTQMTTARRPSTAGAVVYSFLTGQIVQ